MKRYVIQRSMDAAAVLHHRNELPNALWVAMHFIEDGPEILEAKMTDTATGRVYDAQEIRDLASQTPAWQSRDWNTPDT
jgi:hypothetical protein